jgi:hypothetical protein|nr:hypothetical protein [Kofleriaceae bacterium]
MRRFITSAALAISLLGTAGFADARGFGNGREVGHGPVVVNRGPVRGGEIRGGERGGEIRYRDHGFRPERRAEHFDYRAGFNWHAGDWSWNGAEWVWVPGYYVRVVL